MMIKTFMKMVPLEENDEKKSISESCGIDFDKLCSAAHLKILVTYCGADATRTKCSRKRLHWGCIRTGDASSTFGVSAKIVFRVN